MVYDNLKEFAEAFQAEAKIINYVKCCLVSNIPLEDFTIDGISVSVYYNSSGYNLFFQNYQMEIHVYKRQIIDYSVINI